MKRRKHPKVLCLYILKELFLGNERILTLSSNLPRKTREKVFLLPSLLTKNLFPRGSQSASLNFKPNFYLAKFCVWSFMGFSPLRSPITISLVLPFI